MISTYAAYKTRLSRPNQRQAFSKAGPALTVGRLFSHWTNTGDAGVAPTTAVVPDNTTLGGLQQFNTSNTQRIIGVRGVAEQPGFQWIIDRLSHQGGLDGTVTSAQTTNLPTAALTRYTSGVGVFIALEIYTAVGSTGTTISVSYTNSAGTAGRTSPSVVFGGVGFAALRRFIVIPLQQGDIGVKSVENVTVLATTGTAGNFGVILFKPLFPMCLISDIGRSYTYDGLLLGGGHLPAVVNNACLHTVLISSVSGVDSFASVRFAQD